MATNDDGGPAFVATAKCSVEYEDGFQYWEKALPLRGDESAVAIWEWGSKGKPYGLDSIVIVKTDAMLTERTKQEPEPCATKVK